MAEKKKCHPSELIYLKKLFTLNKQRYRITKISWSPVGELEIFYNPDPFKERSYRLCFIWDQGRWAYGFCKRGDRFHAKQYSWLYAYSPEDVFSIWDRSYVSLTQFMMCDSFVLNPRTDTDI